MASASSGIKGRLMRNLKLIRTTHYALRLCSLIIEVQEMNAYRQPKKKLCSSIPDCSSREERILNHIKEILNEIKEILNLEPVDRLVKIILKALNAPKEMQCREKQQLLTILWKLESDNKPEYLHQLIVTVKSLVALFQCSRLKKMAQQKELILLKELTFCFGRYRTEKVLCEMFQLCINKYEFSWEEKKEIGDLVINSMPSIQTLIENLCYDFDYAVDHASLQQRSSLQFIRDLLADYSAGHDILKRFVGSLDEVMQTQDNVAVWSNYPDLYDPSDDSSRVNDEDIPVELHEMLEDFNNAGAPLVPKEHTWWQVYKKAYFQYVIR